MHVYAVCHWRSLSFHFQRSAFKRIDYTEGFVSIIDDKIKINMNWRGSLGFSGSDVWIKSDYAKGFAVTMGSFNESKICEILYILRKLGKSGKDRTV